MPYKSEAQRGYFHAHKEELEKEGVDVDEYDKESKGKKLPARVSPKPGSRGKKSRQGRPR